MNSKVVFLDGTLGQLEEQGGEEETPRGIGRSLDTL